MSFRFLFLLVLVLPFAPVYGQTPGKLTYVDGNVLLIRDTHVVAAIAGLPVEDADLIETGAGAYAMVEFDDGSRLGLGGETRLMLRALTPHGKDATREFALLGGWVKAQSPIPAGERAYRIESAKLALTWREASLVFQVGTEKDAFFVESGSASAAVVDRRGRAGAAKDFRRGNFVTQATDRTLATRDRPGTEFVEAMPRPFRDPLPDLLAHFGARTVSSRVLREADYSEVGPWLQGPKAWRRPLVTRFSSRAGDPVFRRALIENLKVHPEWSRVLYPERYRRR